MRLNVSAWAIRKPIPSLVLFLVLMVLGLVSFRSLPITRFPNIDIPIVSVTVTQSGAAPSELQTQVTKWVEDSIAGVRGGAPNETDHMPCGNRCTFTITRAGEVVPVLLAHCWTSGSMAASPACTSARDVGTGIATIARADVLAGPRSEERIARNAKKKVREVFMA